MALAAFFDRVYGAVGAHLQVSRESLIAALENVVVGIRCSPVPSQNDECIAELATNLVARLYPKIAISAEPALQGSLRQLASRINPCIEHCDVASPLTTIYIGTPSDEGSLFPSASGWVARLDHNEPGQSGPYNPFAAAVSAAFACAELFRRVFLKSVPDRDLSLSLLDFGRDLGQQFELHAHDIRDVAFVGVGAVGNAAIWALAHHTCLTGTLSLVDHEALTLSNLQRYVLGAHRDVSKPKVRLAGRCLRNAKLKVVPIKKTLEEFAAKEGSHLATVCVSVDNVQTRRAAQALLPRLVINGWTGERSLGASWHMFSRDAACLACLYQPHGQGISATEQAAKALGFTPERAAFLWVTRQPLSEEDVAIAAAALGVSVEKLAPWRNRSLGELYTDVVCGAVPLDVTGLGKVESVPLAHQSVLAGILMASELVKRTDPALAHISAPEPLISWDDILTPPPTLWRKPRPREEGCICTDETYQEVYRDKWE